jgi:3-oxoacyl-[acyl-carrier-protein] synthase III
MALESNAPVSATIRPADFDEPAGIKPVVGGAAVASVGVAVPETVVGSAEIEARLGLEPGWIERRTGIRSRHVAHAGERADAYAAIAAERALQRAGIDPQQVDMVIAATTTSDELMPNMAPIVAHAIGATRAGAFDVGSACSGFLSALAAGTGLVDSGRANCVVVIGADFMTRFTDPSDRGTAAVFADGAGAVVLLATGEPGRISPIILGSEGDTEQIIRIPRERPVIQMVGHETFKIAVARLSESTEQALAAARLGIDDIDLFVYHQANGRILTAVGERLGLPSDRVVDCIGELGNTSAATLPLALEHCYLDGRLHDGDRVLLGAFGAGFTWGATVVEWGLAA